MNPQPKPTSARAKLAHTIKHFRERSTMDHRIVSRVCATSPSTVAAWEDGTLVPTSDQWGKLKRAVHRGHIVAAAAASSAAWTVATAARSASAYAAVAAAADAADPDLPRRHLLDLAAALEAL